MWYKTCDMWHKTCDMWHMTPDTWYVTCDPWHMTCDLKKKLFTKSVQNTKQYKKSLKCIKVPKNAKE